MTTLFRLGPFLALLLMGLPARSEPRDITVLQGLDKVTARVSTIEAPVGQTVRFGALEIIARTCDKRPPEEPPESAAFLKIASTQPVAVETMEAAVDAEDVETVSEDNPELFSGWMYASSPGLSALEHPVYDIWVIRCAAPDPVKLAPRPSEDDPEFE